MKLKTDKIERSTTFALFAMELMEEGYKNIVCGYEGAGDSGGLEYVTASKSDYEGLIEEANSWDPEGELLNDKDYYGIIEDYILDKLNNVEDWWNNDGGYGVMIINLKTGNYNIENTVRYTAHEYYNHTGKIID